MTELVLRGMFPAFPTPITDAGEIDATALERIVEHQIGDGAAGLVPLGGTGEALSLTMAQRIRALDVTVAAAGGRVPVMAGVLDPGLGGAIDSAKAYEACGADGLMVIPPYYARPDQEGVLRYMRALARETRLPFMLYDNPYRAHVVLDPDTVVRMAEDGLAVGMKASNTDLFHFDRVAQRVPDSFGLLSGQDTLFVEQAMLGARGGVLTSACLIPGYWNGIQELVEAGQVAQAIARQRRLHPLFAALFDEAFPEAVRQAFRLIGLPVGRSLPPVGDLSAAATERLARAIRDLVDDGTLRAAR